MKVKATAFGYYDLKRKKVGDVFFLTSSKHFSPNWMEKLETEEKGSPILKKGKAPEEKPAA